MGLISKVTEDPLLIRAAMDSDLPSIIDVFNRSSAAELDVTGRQPFQFDGSRIKSMMAGNQTLVAVSLGNIAAFCIVDLDGLNNESSLIRALYVDPPYLRKRIGTKLLTAAIELSASKSLLVTCHQANRSARSLYEKNGFVYLMHCKEDCLYIREALSP